MITAFKSHLEESRFILHCSQGQHSRQRVNVTERWIWACKGRKLTLLCTCLIAGILLGISPVLPHLILTVSLQGTMISTT